MNKIDLTQQGGFPLTQDTLNFMQSAYNEGFSALAGLLGDKVIISGCNTYNNVVASGFVAVNGEILYSPGGAGTKVFIRENGQGAIFEDGQSRNVYLRRTLEFGVGTPQFNWSEFKKLSSIIELTGSIVPSGAIMMWYGSISEIPVGWKICNGTNGTPDMRKRFPVGADSDSGTSEYRKGLTGGKEKHALQSSEMPSHSHQVTDPGHIHELGLRVRGNENGTNKWTAANDNNTLSSKSARTGISIQNTGGGQEHENRPPYLALHFIMKI